MPQHSVSCNPSAVAYKNRVRLQRSVNRVLAIEWGKDRTLSSDLSVYSIGHPRTGGDAPPTVTPAYETKPHRSLRAGHQSVHSCQFDRLHHLMVYSLEYACILTIHLPSVHSVRDPIGDNTLAFPKFAVGFECRTVQSFSPPQGTVER